MVVRYITIRNHSPGSGPGRTALHDKLSETSNQEIQRLHPLKPMHRAKITGDHTTECWWEFPKQSAKDAVSFPEK